MPTKTKAAPEPLMEDSALFEDPITDEPTTDEPSEDSSYAEPDQPIKLLGQELLDFYAAKKEAGRTHAEIAYDAGYYTITKTGQERVMMAQFNQAYLEAQGVETGGKSTAAAGRSHAGLTKARVSGQGILLVSQLATRNVGAEPGHVFEVSYPGEGSILLSPTGEIKPVVSRKKSAEEPGAPLLDQAA